VVALCVIRCKYPCLVLGVFGVGNVCCDDNCNKWYGINAQKVTFLFISKTLYVICCGNVDSVDLEHTHCHFLSTVTTPCQAEGRLF
jgi:hypothetical protein